MRRSTMRAKDRAPPPTPIAPVIHVRVCSSCPPPARVGYSVVERKKRMLPLMKVLAGEPKGGWGRTIAGVVKMKRFLMRSPETMAEASGLQAHLDVVCICRQLQPANVASLADDAIVAAVQALEKVNIELPEAAQHGLLHRRCVNLRRCLLK